MNVDSDELLQHLMSSYVASVQCSIADIAHKYPAFIVELGYNYQLKNDLQKANENYAFH